MACLDGIRARAAAQSQSGTEYDSEAVTISQENVHCQTWDARRQSFVDLLDGIRSRADAQSQSGTEYDSADTHASLDIFTVAVRTMISPAP